MGKVFLGDVAKERRETCKGDKNGYPIVGLEHLTPEEITLSAWDEDKDNTFTKLFYEGDILFGRRRAYLKKAAVAPFNGICSGDITVIEAIPEKILPELLPFVIQNDVLFDFAVGKSAGSLSPRVKWEHLRNYQFELPDLDKQRELAKVLWAMDATKRSYQKLLLKTDELVKSQFIEMFEDDKCDKKCLEELSIEWLKGQPFKKDEISDGGSNRCIHYGELFTKYGPVIKDVLSKTDADVKRASKKGDILFPASDVTPNGLARCSALMQEGIILGGDIIVMRPLQENNSVYLSYAINYQKMQLLSRVTGAVVKHISAKSLKSVIVPLPSRELQNKFVVLTEQSDKSKFELEQALMELNATYKKIISENLG